MWPTRHGCLVLALVLVMLTHVSSTIISRRALAGSAAAAVLSLRLPPARVLAAPDEIVSTVLIEGDPTSPTPARAQKAVVDYTLWINDFEGKQIDTSKGKLLPIPRPPSPFVFSVVCQALTPNRASLARWCAAR